MECFLQLPPEIISNILQYLPLKHVRILTLHPDKLIRKIALERLFNDIEINALHESSINEESSGSRTINMNYLQFEDLMRDQSMLHTHHFAITENPFILSYLLSKYHDFFINVNKLTISVTPKLRKSVMDFSNYDNLSKLNIELISIRDFAKWKYPRYLKELSVSMTSQIRSRASYPLNKMIELPCSLQKLSIREAGLTDYDFVWFQFDRLVQLKRLDLSYNKFVTPRLKNLPASLKFLDLQYNQITSLQSFQFPSGLEQLILRANKIDTLDYIEFPDSLEVIDLLYCPAHTIRAFPTSLKSLYLTKTVIGLPQTLTSLYFSFYKQAIDNITFPESLRKLSLNVCTINGPCHLPRGLTELSVDSCNLRSLQYLILPKSLQLLSIIKNPLGSLELTEFPSTLRKLYIKHCDIAYVADSFVLNEGLKEFSLTGNPYLSDVSQLRIPDSVEVLSINDTSISSLHDFKLPLSLKTFEWCSNEVTELCNISFPVNVQEINLSNNAIMRTDNFTLPPNLKSLMMNTTRIGDQEACKLKFPSTLETLSLDDNSISCINSLNLPDSLSHFSIRKNGMKIKAQFKLPHSLVHFDCSENHIRDGINKIKFNSKLIYLNLSYTGILDISKLEFPPTLELLELTGNCMTSIENVHFPPKLIHLGIARNKIKELNSKVCLPPRLVKLYLYDSELQTITVDFTFPESLRMLDLNHNYQLSEFETSLVPTKIEILSILDNPLLSVSFRRELLLFGNIYDIGVRV